MKMNGMRVYELELDFKSAVHVGTGGDHEYPAYAYLPDFAKKEVVLLDPERLVVELEEDRRDLFLRAVADGPVRAQRLLRGWHEEGVPLPELGRLPASPAFLNTVKNASGDAMLGFRPLPRSLEGPYLPGSSVKGALRTAWIYYQLEPKLQQRDLVYVDDHRVWEERPAKKEEGYIRPGRGGPRAAQLLEGYALGYLRGGKPNMYRDPFRAVRLGDGPPLAATRLERGGTFHPKRADKGEIALMEVIPAGTRLRIPFRYHEGLFRHKVVAGKVDTDDLVDAARTFYEGVLDEELSYAQQNGWGAAADFYRSLLEEAKANDGSFLLRIGFGSGKLSNTLLFLMDEAFPITRKSAGNSMPQMGLPLGWVKARLIEAER